MFKKYQWLLIALLAPLLLHAKAVEEKVDLKIDYYGCPAIAVHFETAYIQHSRTTIVLTDGSQWVIRNRNGEEVLSEMVNSWLQGDEIRIGTRTPEQYQGKYILKNMRNQAVYLVDLEVSFQEKSTPYFIDKIDENGYLILTQNGLEWAIGWWGGFTTRKWRKGDRIIINKSEHSSSEDYLLINVDKGTDVWASLIHWR